ESMRYVTENGLPSTDCSVYWEKPISHSRLATSAMAAFTPTAARKYTSARCAVAQSTTATVTTLGSVGGRSTRQSPTSRATHFSVRGPCVSGAAIAVVVLTAVAAVGVGV